jgi:CRISPR/Cas system-associated endoribonuclease Cas2
MLKFSFLIFFLSFVISSTSAQPQDSLRTLLTQREQLVKDYHYYNAQNSNFWGKKSKKDLLLIIETLKGIIRKDTEIINTIKVSTLRKAATLTVEQNKMAEQVKDDRLAVSNTIYSLKTQIANLENLQKTRQRKINELTSEVEQERSKRTDRDKLIAFVGMLLVALMLYTFNLRKKMNGLASKKLRN